LVAAIGQHNPGNIFPEMTVDTAGNLYYTWSQSQQGPADVAGNGNSFTGETDVYYSYSTDGGITWAPPVNLSPTNGDSEVFPWMIAGDPGQVDLVYYQASNGQNPNDLANSAIWNVYFDQSQNALNQGANFKNVQISDHPNHFGQICTGGLGCSTGGNRNLLDFFTVDVDHLGAANVIWADDYNSFGLAHAKFSRQVAGNSVFNKTNISLQSTWPIKDHSVIDQAGDVTDAEGIPTASCPSMDLLGTQEKASNDVLTVSLSLNAPPASFNATACSPGATNGLWGAEFWAASSTYPPGDNFYIAFDGTNFEAGRVESINLTLTSNEFHRLEPATGDTTTNCVTPTPCTITMSTSLSGLGIKDGAGLYSITGFALYDYGQANRTIPGTTLSRGWTQQADVATPFDDNGTGTLTTVQ
jgi:hypothetical protein